MIKTKLLKDTRTYRQLITVMSVRRAMKALRQFERLEVEEGRNPLYEFNGGLTDAVCWNDTVEGGNYWAEISRRVRHIK